MSRAIEWEETVSTSTFSILQLQPGVVATLTWNAIARWFRSYIVSFPSLIRDESVGLVVIGFHLEYRDKVSFFECETFRIRAAFRMMRRGELGQLDIRIFNETNELAVAKLIVRPVAILDPISLGAEPVAMPKNLLARFNPDEVESASPMRVVAERVGAVETTATLLGEHTKAFRIHRHLSEVAEQWSWTETPALVESARESFALTDRSENKMLLRRCLSNRLLRFDVEFSRPYFSFESGEIVSRAYDLANHLAFVHRFTSSGGKYLHATVVEVFDST